VTEYEQNGHGLIPGNAGIPPLSIMPTSTQSLMGVRWTESEADYSMSCNKLRIRRAVLPFAIHLRGKVLNKHRTTSLPLRMKVTYFLKPFEILKCYVNMN
jgi:hypothetical protein